MQGIIDAREQAVNWRSVRLEADQDVLACFSNEGPVCPSRQTPNLAGAYTNHHDPGDPKEGVALDLVCFKDRVQTSRAAIPDQRFGTQRLFADGDNVVATWFWSATHCGDLQGFSAPDKNIRISVTTVYNFDGDDRLTGHWRITGWLAIYQQLQPNMAANC